MPFYPLPRQWNGNKFPFHHEVFKYPNNGTMESCFYSILFHSIPLCFIMHCSLHLDILMNHPKDLTWLWVQGCQKASNGPNSTLKNWLIRWGLISTYIDYLGTIFSQCRTSTCPCLSMATRHVGLSTPPLYLGVTTI